MRLMSVKSSRRESAINTYYRLEENRLALVIKADWEVYVEKCKAEGKVPNTAGHRNQLLKKLYEAESDEVKERVEKARLEPRANDPATVMQKLVNDEEPIEEEERQRLAGELQA